MVYRVIFESWRSWQKAYEWCTAFQKTVMPVHRFDCTGHRLCSTTAYASCCRLGKDAEVVSSLGPMNLVITVSWQHVPLLASRQQCFSQLVWSRTVRLTRIPICRISLVRFYCRCWRNGDCGSISHYLETYFLNTWSITTSLACDIDRVHETKRTLNDEKLINSCI